MIEILKDFAFYAGIILFTGYVLSGIYKEIELRYNEKIKNMKK